MIRLNAAGMVMLMGSALIALVLASILKFDESINVIIAGTLITLADVIYRLRYDAAQGENRWFAGGAGGFIALGPAWIIGLVLLVMGVLAFNGLGDLS